MGKRPANPRAAEVKRVRVQLTEACKEKAVDRVLEIFHECEVSELVLPQSSLAQALSALASAGEACAEQPRVVQAALGCEAARAEHFGHAQRMFERARADSQDWGGQGESIYTLMVRLASRAGELDVAMQYLREMRQPPLSIRPKLRTFVPILEACASAGFAKQAEILYREDVLPACSATEASALWTSEEEDRLWQCIFGLRLRAWSAASDKMDDGERHSCLNAILEDISSICPQLRSDSGIVDALRDAFEVFKWRTACGVHISSDGLCPVTSEHLQSIRPCEADLSSLLSLIERLAIENASQRKLDEWARFKSWLSRCSLRWDTVIDGANIGHCNQNFDRGAFSHQQIDALVTQCTRSGSRKCAVVLRGHWLLPDTDLTLPQVKRKKRQLPQLGASTEPEKDPEPEPQLPVPVEGAEPARGFDEDFDFSFNAAELSEEKRLLVDIGRKWQEQGVLVVSPPSINDDWVALYIAVEMCLRGVPDVQFVSNDELRDHFWRMRQPLAFQTWREHHSTRYQIFSERPASGSDAAASDMSVQLFPPPLYSHRTQKSLDGKCWYFPVRLKEAAPEASSAEARDATHEAHKEPQLEWVVACDASKVSERQPTSD